MQQHFKSCRLPLKKCIETKLKWESHPISTPEKLCLELAATTNVVRWMGWAHPTPKTQKQEVCCYCQHYEMTLSSSEAQGLTLPGLETLEPASNHWSSRERVAEWHMLLERSIQCVRMCCFCERVAQLWWSVMLCAATYMVSVMGLLWVWVYMGAWLITWTAWLQLSVGGIYMNLHPRGSMLLKWKNHCLLS